MPESGSYEPLRSVAVIASALFGVNGHGPGSRVPVTILISECAQRPTFIVTYYKTCKRIEQMQTVNSLATADVYGERNSSQRCRRNVRVSIVEASNADCASG
jgi:hypothetical protein